MLVLTRQRDESVIITTGSGVEIEVTVTEIRGDKVRLGFTAPGSVTVDRREVHLAKRAGEAKKT